MVKVFEIDLSPHFIVILLSLTFANCKFNKITNKEQKKQFPNLLIFHNHMINNISAFGQNTLYN